MNESRNHLGSLAKIFLTDFTHRLGRVENYISVKDATMNICDNYEYKSYRFKPNVYYPVRMKCNNCYVNPLVPWVQKLKISKFAVNWLLIVEFVKEIVRVDAHYTERQGLMG